MKIVVLVVLDSLDRSLSYSFVRPGRKGQPHRPLLASTFSGEGLADALEGRLRSR